MSIQLKLFITTATAISLTLILGAALFLTTQQVNENRAKVLIVDEIVKKVNDLNTLTLELILHPSERIKEQWQIQHQEVDMLLSEDNFKSEEEQRILGKIIDNHNSAKPIFTDLSEASPSSQLSTILAGQLITRKREIVTDAYNLSNLERSKSINVREQFNLVLAAFVIAMISLMFSIIWVTNVSIARPLSKLNKAALEIAKTKSLTTTLNISSNDEIGQLAESFKTMLASLKEQFEKEKELDRSKDEFLSITAHHLRTPLGTLRWNLELMLKDKFGKVPASIKPHLTEMSESNLELIGLVNELLNVSRINQNKVIDHPKPFVVADLTKKVIDGLKYIAGQKSVSMNLDVGNVDGLTINLDIALFSQVLQNILSNAIKYNKDSGKVDVRLSKTDKTLKIIVMDTGIGIPQRDQYKLFTKFFRSENAINVSAEGTGLGLYVVKSYIERWGGKVRLESQENKGVIVEIELPILV
jgi:signal transduction histidine kinase